MLLEVSYYGFMKNQILLSFMIFCGFQLLNFNAQASCPDSVNKEWLLGKVANPTKFFTPVKEECDSDTLNVFTNCIDPDNKQLFFGNIERTEPLASTQCPFGYAPRVSKGFFGYERYNDQKVCLDPCHSISVGKTFRDEQRFGERRALSIGDVVFVPELKGKRCGDQKHDGCAIVSQFIEYSNDPILDFFSGTCKNISRGRCLDYHDEKLPSTVTVFKLSPEQAQAYRKAQAFPKVSEDNLELVRTPAQNKSQVR